MGGKMMQDPRPINTNIKTKLINPEKEKPSRWSFLKILREHSDLRLFYPEINPNVTELPVKTSDLVYPALIQRCGMIFALLVFIVFIMMEFIVEKCGVILLMVHKKQCLLIQHLD